MKVLILNIAYFHMAHDRQWYTVIKEQCIIIKTLLLYIVNILEYKNMSIIKFEDLNELEQEFIDCLFTYYESSFYKMRHVEI